MIAVRPSFLLFLFLLPFIAKATTTETHTFSITGSVSSTGTDLRITSGAVGLEFTRSANSQCPEGGPQRCAADVIESLTLDDSVLHSAQGAQYSFGLGKHQVSEEISVNGLPAMDRHEAIYFKERFWVYPPSGDIWSSADAINWLKEGHHSELGRFMAELVKFNGRLFLIGGNPAATNKDDVWVSEDGIHWDLLLENAPFGGRYGHAVSVFNDKMWLVAGESGTYPGQLTNDVWSSLDGENWVLETSSAGFSGRLGHTLSVFDGQLILVAGADTEHGGLSDVWSTTDGVSWIQETQEAGFSGRSRHQTVVHDGRIWVLGGDEGFPICDVWSSANGTNWVREIENTDAVTCARQRVVQDDEAFYSIGGQGADRHRTGSVWKSPDLVAWNMLTRDTHFSPRFGQAVVEFADKLWMIGGDYGERSAEIWSSTDGYHWLRDVESAPFGGRAQHDVLEFSDRLWLIGGGEARDIDIWSSADGITWVQELEVAPFVASHGVQATVHDGEIYVVGSHSLGALDDPIVWSSSDGINWVQKNAAAPFGFRTGFGLISFDGKLFVIAGRDGSFKNDVWTSSDGVEWVQEAESTSFDARAFHQVREWQGKLWLVAGQNQHIREEYVNDAWASDDGVRWASYSIDSGFGIRGYHGLEVFNDRLWVVGGTGHQKFNDVWSSGNGSDWETQISSEYQLSIEYADITTLASNGRIEPSDIRIATGSALDMNIYADDGYMLTTASGCGGILTGSTFRIDDVEADCTVSAELERYSFVFAMSTAGGLITPVEVQQVLHGNSTLFEIKTEEGYQVSDIYGCDGMLDGTTYTTSNITGDCYVAALFERMIYPLSLVVGENGRIVPVDTLTPAHGDVTRLHIIADDGYEIAEVSGCGGELAGPLYTTAAVIEACDVTATFRPRVFDISMNVSEGGELTMAEGATREFGTEIVFDVVAEEGYELRSVSGCAGALNENGDYVVSEITGHCDINAYFGLRTYDMTLSVTSGGDVIYKEVTPLTHGAQQQIQLVPEDGFEVASASGCNGSLDGLVYTAAPEKNCVVDIVFRRVDGAPENPGSDDGDSDSSTGGAVSAFWLSIAAMAFGFRRRRLALLA